MRNVASFWIGLAVALPSIAQIPRESSIRHNQLIEEADAAFNAGSYKVAVPLYDSAQACVNWDVYAYFNATLAALKAGRNDKANEFLLEGVEKGFEPSLYQDPTYTAFLASDASKPFRDHQAEASRKFAAHADSAMIKQLQDLHAINQANRGDNPSSLRNDSLNFEALLQICGTHGFPVARTVGASSGTAWLLLWHHRGREYPDSPQWQRMIPYIHQAIDAGDLDPAFLCMFDDFSDMQRNLPMRYGALAGYYRDAPEKIILVDREQLSANRASVGWGPIEDAAAASGVDLGKVRFAEP